MPANNLHSTPPPVHLVDYSPTYHTAFRDLNTAWIRKYFQMEDSDRNALNHPQEYILDGGGCIIVALEGSIPVGVCALIKMDHPKYDFELAKMAVSPASQGRGIGQLLGIGILEKAKNLGARKVYLETNTLLTPALNLYQKLGFKEITGYPSPYERCNMQMVFEIDA